MNKHWYVAEGQHCSIYKVCTSCKETKHRQKDFYRKSGSNGKGKGNVSTSKTASRCKQCENKHKYTSRKWKPFLIKVYGEVCQYCGKQEHRNRLGIDHKVPVSKGGSDDIVNLALCCNSCNVDKGDLTYEEYMVQLAKKGNK